MIVLWHASGLVLRRALQCFSHTFLVSANPVPGYNKEVFLQFTGNLEQLSCPKHVQQLGHSLQTALTKV